MLWCGMCFRYKTDINSYKQKVKESIESCRQATLNPDPSDPHSVKYENDQTIQHCVIIMLCVLRMGEWTIEVMKKARTEIFEPEVKLPLCD